MHSTLYHNVNYCIYKVLSSMILYMCRGGKGLEMFSLISWYAVFLVLCVLWRTEVCGSWAWYSPRQMSC